MSLVVINHTTCHDMLKFISLLWTISILCKSVSKADDVLVYGVNTDMYSKPGDVNIGSIMTLTRGLQDFVCTKSPMPSSWGIEYPEAVAFAVDAVNKNPDLLPNLTLGFYILDDCYARSMSLTQSLAFLPRSHASSNNSSSPTTQSGPLASAIQHYPVVGILAPMLSAFAVPVSYLYTAARLPLVGYTTTSDELSDKSLHPNYVRVISPDKYQALAMLRFISDQGWTYVSVVYSQGPYGELAYDTIKSSAGSFKICIAVNYRVLDSEPPDTIGQALLNSPRARAVILFLDINPALRLFDYIGQVNATGQFVWITSDSIASATEEDFRPYKKCVIGAFMFLHYAPLVREFYESLSHRDVMTSSNPWFRYSWELLFNCSVSAGTCNTTLDVVRDADFGYMHMATLAMDAVLTYAHSIHNLISDVCPDVDNKDAMDCIQRHSLLNYIHNVTFRGYSGDVSFSSNGDVIGKYVIFQMSYDNVTPPFNIGYSSTPFKMGLVKRDVAVYDTMTHSITYTSNSIFWDHMTLLDRFVPLGASETVSGKPESVCSRPCVLGEYKVQKDQECCWECRRCRDNERIVNMNTGCAECPEFTWPDLQTNYTTCLEITLTHPSLTATLTIVQIILAVLGLILNLSVISLYICYRQSRVIKASSRELSFIQLAAILVGYVTVICFQSFPAPVVCSVLYLIFCMSFALLYSPLLVKTIRIYRIFKSSIKNNKRPQFVSPQWQIIFSACLIIIQTIICVVIFITNRPTSKRTQLVRTENFVEVACDMTFPGLISFLAYNLIQVTLCSVFAVKTRKLPDNFNESRFISMCVSTTLVIWLAFIPTYFTAGREYVRVLLLSVALLLNHTVALVFLFLPKLYAAVYLPCESATVTRFNTNTSHVLHLPTRNRVAPSPVSHRSDG